MKRRQLLTGAAASLAMFHIVPRHVLGGPNHVAPSEKINLAIVAAGAEVWVTSGSDEKIEKAIALGAKGGVNYKDPNWTKNLLSAAGADRSGYFDVIIDSAGGPSFAKLIDVATIGARICFFGGTTGNITDIVPAKVFFKHLSIFGSTMGSDKDFAAMVAFVNQHQIKPVIDEIFPLEEAETALRRMDAGSQFGKIVLKP